MPEITQTTIQSPLALCPSSVEYLTSFPQEPRWAISNNAKPITQEKLGPATSAALETLGPAGLAALQPYMSQALPAATPSLTTK